MRNATIAAAFAALVAGPASATTFDFAQWALDNSQGRTEVPFTGMTVDGVTVTASTNAGYVHADAYSRAGSPSAGIGPCQIDDCNGRGEDGFAAGETLTLTFDMPVHLTGIVLRESAAGRVSGDPDHTLAQGTFGLQGQVWQVVDGAPLDLPTFTGTEFTFSFGDETTGSDYYLSAVTAELAPVPVPAAGVLLLGALGGLAMVRRKRSQA